MFGLDGEARAKRNREQGLAGPALGTALSPKGSGHGAFGAGTSQRPTLQLGLGDFMSSPSLQNGDALGSEHQSSALPGVQGGHGSDGQSPRGLTRGRPLSAQVTRREPTTPS